MWTRCTLHVTQCVHCRLHNVHFALGGNEQEEDWISQPTSTRKAGESSPTVLYSVHCVLFVCCLYAILVWVVTNSTVLSSLCTICVLFVCYTHLSCHQQHCTRTLYLLFVCCLYAVCMLYSVESSPAALYSVHCNLLFECCLYAVLITQYSESTLWMLSRMTFTLTLQKTWILGSYSPLFPFGEIQGSVYI